MLNTEKRKLLGRGKTKLRHLPRQGQDAGKRLAQAYDRFLGEQGLEVNDRLSRVRFRAFVWRPWAMNPSSSADLRRRPIVIGRLYVMRATSKQGRGSPLLVTKWRRSVEPGKAEHLGIRMNEEHTILTVADGECRRGCNTTLSSSLIPDFQGSHLRYTEQQGITIQKRVREEYRRRCCSGWWLVLLYRMHE